ncbi:MAG TPA: hypothetical protein VFV65_03495 [Gemmatimonadales bacterium]|nr:hypothetical protein [Gemmatimonadales bacterium]
MRAARRGLGAALLVAAVAAPVAAQGPPLAFYGFRAGVSLADTDAQVRLLLGNGLRCQRSQADRRLADCRATITDPVANTPVTIWLAAIDSTTGVLTLSATLPAREFDRWRDVLESVYGPRTATIQGGQGMVQWIRGTQMLRLTWRAAPNRIESSVSIVDGPVLDGWNVGAPPSTQIAKPRAPG